MDGLIGGGGGGGGGGEGWTLFGLCGWHFHTILRKKFSMGMPGHPLLVDDKKLSTVGQNTPNHA